MTNEPAISFDQYQTDMMPVVRRIIRGGYPGHPTMNPEDLRAEAITTLYSIYRRFAHRLPTMELFALGTRAVKCRLITLYHRSRIGQKRQGFDTHIPHRSYVIKTTGQEEVIDNRATFLESLEVRQAVERVMTQLTDRTQTLINEMLSPSNLTREIAQQALHVGLGGNRVLAHAASRVLGQNADQRHLRRLLKMIGHQIRVELGYKEACDITKGGCMQIPTPSEPINPDEDVPAKTAPKKKTVKKKPKLKAAPVIFDKDTIGKTAMYLGGSKAKWCKKGALGKVIERIAGGRRVRIRFAEGKGSKRVVVFSAKFLQVIEESGNEKDIVLKPSKKDALPEPASV